MTLTDQTAALREFGYSPAEAEFVAKAALHSGYFLARQFKAERGGPADRLCRKALAFDHATVRNYGKRSVYHLKSKPLYRALGQEDNRHRREQDTYRLRAKLMGFDYVLLHPQYRYLPTEQEKLEYFVEARGVALSVLPTKVYSGEQGDKTQRFFIDKFPIRIDPATDQVAFCYVDAGVFADIAFTTWLGQYAPLITALGSAEVVYVANSEARFAEAEREFRKTFSAIPPDVMTYFLGRREIEAVNGIGIPQKRLDAVRALRRRYSDAAYERKYVAWLNGENPSDSEAQVGFSTYVIPHSYSWFGTLSKEK